MTSVCKPGLDKSEAGAPEAEVEITPEMIEAGVSVLWESGGHEPMDGVDQLVIERIFVAMSRVAVYLSSR
jgi:hypothetical protein